MSVEQLSFRSYIAWLGCAMTTECLSIKKKELIKTIHTNYFNQSKNERKNKRRRSLHLKRPLRENYRCLSWMFFVVVMLKNKGKSEKNVWIYDIKQHSLWCYHKRLMLKRYLWLSDVKYHCISVRMLIHCLMGI